MKKIVSLLLVVMMAFSLVSTTAFAAVGNVRVTLDKTECVAGETIVATIDSLEKDIDTEGFNLTYDKSKVTYVGMKYYNATTGAYANLTRAGQIKVTRWWGEGDTEEQAFSTAENSVAQSMVGFGYSYTESAKILAKEGLVKIEFTVNADATGDIVFTLNENSGGNDGYKGVVETKTVTVKGNEPEAPVVRDNPTIVDLAKTWTVDIDADYVAAGDTLTATLYDTTNETDTQEVTLSMGNNVVVGGAAWSFTLKATFENAAKMADIGLRVSK